MKSVPQFSVYTKPKGDNLPASGLHTLLFQPKVSVWLASEHYTWVFIELEQLIGRSCAALNLLYLLGGCVNLCVLHIDCSISIQICLKSVYLHLIARRIHI
jgi:hypothetical protein